jgi:hypothetical protein
MQDSKREQWCGRIIAAPAGETRKGNLKSLKRDGAKRGQPSQILGLGVLAQDWLRKNWLRSC